METKPRHAHFPPLLAAAFASLLPIAMAQQVTSPPGSLSTSASSGEVVQLSPFQVSTEADRGYQALNTLSGTRLNSKLEDLGSSISVVTMQQMIDTAVTDLNDVLLYEASTEGTGNFTQFTPNRNGGVGDNVSSDPARANRIRGVGSAGTSGSGHGAVETPRIAEGICDPGSATINPTLSSTT